MSYKIIQRIGDERRALKKDGTFFNYGKVKQFDSKGEAVAFMIRYLKGEHMGDYVIEEVTRND
jgi:hypothetical protein